MSSRSSSVPTIEDVKALQREHQIIEHVVYIGEATFVVAHTDEERATIDLEDCPLHQWLLGLDGPPAAVGYYIAVEHEADAYSEPLGADPWDLLPFTEGDDG